MKIPCETCISYAICKNRPMVKCSIVMNMYIAKDWETWHLDQVAKFLTQEFWSMSEGKEITFYTPVEAGKYGLDEETKPEVVYKFDDTWIGYYVRTGPATSEFYRLPPIKDKK